MGHPALQEHQQAQSAPPSSARQSCKRSGVWGGAGAGQCAPRMPQRTQGRAGRAVESGAGGRSEGKGSRARAEPRETTSRGRGALPTDVCASRVLDRVVHSLAHRGSKWEGAGAPAQVGKGGATPGAAPQLQAPARHRRRSSRPHAPPRAHSPQARPARGGGPH